VPRGCFLLEPLCICMDRIGSMASTWLKATKGSTLGSVRRTQTGAVRDLHEVVDLAGRHGFQVIETMPTPANNLSIIFRRDAR
jgi:hypothetical protein